jgi:hypothetical protein
LVHFLHAGVEEDGEVEVISGSPAAEGSRIEISRDRDTLDSEYANGRELIEYSGEG